MLFEENPIYILCEIISIYSSWNIDFYPSTNKCHENQIKNGLFLWIILKENGFVLQKHLANKLFYIRECFQFLSAISKTTLFTYIDWSRHSTIYTGTEMSTKSMLYKILRGWFVRPLPKKLIIFITTYVQCIHKN